MSNPAARLNELVTVLDRLETLMSQETALLRRVRISEAAPIAAEKQRLAEVYAQMHQQLVEDPAPLSILNDSQRQGLRDILGHFRKTADENERAVKACKTVSERVIQTVVNAVKNKRVEHASYGANGLVGGGWKEQKGVSLALDQRV
jgi:flagellar biosynthesis/type III secretory pathway chaperone